MQHPESPRLTPPDMRFALSPSIATGIPSIPRTAKEKLLSSTARNGEQGLN